jgi:hypothetical protein
MTNTGSNNSGNGNSGDWNSGNGNSGDWNSGYRNSGYRNSGDWNSGYGNSGDGNSGDWNSGYWNSGYWNSGYRNSGDWNSGDWNSGYRNSGDWNSGYGNSGNRNSGIFCTTEPECFCFNKPSGKKFDDIEHPDLSNYSPTEWIESSKMTEEEKKRFPNHGNTGGCLRTYPYKEMWSRGWAKDTEMNKKRFMALPNFDADIFLEITGIDVRKQVTCAGKIVEIDGKKYKLQEVP